MVPTAGQPHRLRAWWTGLRDHFHADGSQGLPWSNALALLGHNFGPDSGMAASVAYVAALEAAVADLSAGWTSTIVALVRVSLLMVAFWRNTAGLVAGGGLGRSLPSTGYCYLGCLATAGQFNFLMTRIAGAHVTAAGAAMIFARQGTSARLLTRGAPAIAALAAAGMPPAVP